MRAAEDLANIAQATVGQMIQHIPNEWEVSQEVREALVELVVSRAVYVANTIEARLWPQGELFPEEEEEDWQR